MAKVVKAKGKAVKGKFARKLEELKARIFLTPKKAGTSDSAIDSLKTKVDSLQTELNKAKVEIEIKNE